MYKTRREEIKDIIQSKPFITLNELEEKFPQVSSMTLRRDIEYFENLGEVIKVRGGARSMKFIKNSLEDSYEFRTTENIEAKHKICEKALEFIETGRSIFLDSGTTVMTLADMLKDEHLIITTTAPNAAIKLLKNKNIIVNLVGGMVGRDNISISGTQAIDYLKAINIDTAFIVPSGFSLQSGFTSGNYNECEVKKLVVLKARKKIVLMDDKKLDRSLPYTFANIANIDILITNTRLSDEITESANRSNTQIIVV